jgi:hypothetical protein
LFDLMCVMSRCMDCKAPERSNLYKDYKVINNRQNDNAEYLSAIIGILNYYYSSKTDATCKSNVIGLLTILRKKYGQKV